MSRYNHFSWNDITESRPNLPDYDKEVLLTVYQPAKNKYQVTTGIRSFTDADGEHWEFKLKNGSPTNWEVISWAEIEPYIPEDETSL